MRSKICLPSAAFLPVVIHSLNFSANEHNTDSLVGAEWLYEHHMNYTCTHVISTQSESYSYDRLR